MKILFVGIFDHNEPNTAFRQAFKNMSSDYRELAWNTCQNVNQSLYDMVNNFIPDLIFLQLQAPNVINDITLNRLKKTGAFIVQWTGDARQPLPNHYIEFGRKINLSLFNNFNDVETMRKAGVNADFLQIAFDHNIYNPNGFKFENFADIVFMGNNYGTTFELSKYRFDMVDFLRKTYGNNFMLFGFGYPKEWKIENLMYQQNREAEIYRSCKIGINLSHYDLKHYASDRLFRIMGCGSMCISKEFPEMLEYENGNNFATFNGSFEDLKAKIDYYLNNDIERQRIANNGCNNALTKWNWNNRIDELLQLTLKYRK